MCQSRAQNPTRQRIATDQECCIINTLTLRPPPSHYRHHRIIYDSSIAGNVPQPSSITFILNSGRSPTGRFRLLQLQSISMFVAPRSRLP